MLILFNTIIDEVTHELDVEKMTKKTWNTSKVKSSGVSQILKGHAQSLKRDYENLFTDEYDLILDFFGKLSCIVIELGSLGECS